MISLLLHVFLVTPSVHWLLDSRRRWSRRVGFVMSMSFLVVLAILQSARWEASHFDVLGVSRDATKAEIVRAYRSASLNLHPDKGGNQADFMRLQQAHETLTDPGRRRKWELFGTEEISILVVGVTYCAKLLFSMTISTGKDLGRARAWIVSYLLLGAGVDVLSRWLGEKSLLSFIPFVGQWTVAEQLSWLDRLYPSVISGSILLSRALWEDWDEILIDGLRALEISQNGMAAYARKSETDPTPSEDVPTPQKTRKNSVRPASALEIISRPQPVKKTKSRVALLLKGLFYLSIARSAWMWINGN